MSSIPGLSRVFKEARITDLKIRAIASENKKEEIKNKIDAVKRATKSLHEATANLKECLMPDVEILLKKEDVKGLSNLIDKLPECFFKYTVWLKLDELQKKHERIK